MNIEIANFNQAQAVASLHKNYLTKSFLGVLGNKFLTLLYESLIKFDNGIVLTAVENGQVVGFISGTTKTGDFYKYFLKHKFFGIGITLLPKMINPKVVKKILETSKYSKEEVSPQIQIPTPELLSMAVNKNHQGKGLAKQLFEQLTLEFEKRGIMEFKIIAGEKLLAANKFYQKMGCEHVSSTEIHEGDSSIIYKYQRNK